MTEEKRQVGLVVIGGGPGGYVAAFRAADLGLDVTLIDPENNPGGVCLYRGCIPSKALLHAAKLIRQTRHAELIGLQFDGPHIDLPKLRSWKENVVRKLTSGLGQLVNKRKIDHLQGMARFHGSRSLLVTMNDGSSLRLEFEHAIIATGSRATRLPFPGHDDDGIWDSTAALSLQKVPESLLVVGGGYIGLELGSVYAALGCEVTMVEMEDSLLPGVDLDLMRPLAKRLKSQLNAIRLSTKVTGMEQTSAGIELGFSDVHGKRSTGRFENVLVSIGRQPRSNDLGLEKTSVIVEQSGFIRVDRQMRTDDPRIFAIGDTVGQPMLAHKASAEGKVAAEVIAGKASIADHRAIPAVVFTDPEIAWAGLTEAEAARRGIDVSVGKFPWGASGRALTMDCTDGLTKLLVDPQTHHVLGAGIVGSGAGELIAEAMLAIEMGAVADDLELTTHPHPTLTETLMEAAELSLGHGTHVFR